MSEETPAPAVAQAAAVTEPDLAGQATESLPVAEVDSLPTGPAETAPALPVEPAAVPVPTPAPGVGSILRTAREARNLAVADVAKSLKLSTRQIEALESGDWSRLPGMTFVRGFARNYARLLQIDASVLLAAFDAEKPAAEPVKLALPPSEGATLPQAGRPERRDLMVVITGVLLVVAALAVYFLMPQGVQGEPDKAASAGEEAAVEPTPADVAPEPVVPASPETIPAAPAATTATAPVATSVATPPAVVTPPAAPALASDARAKPLADLPAKTAAAAPQANATVANAAVPVPAPATTPVPGAPAKAASSATPASAALAVEKPSAAAAQPAAAAGGEASLVFSFAKPAWVEVRDRSGQIVFSQLSPAGSERRVDGRPPFTLVVGNATHVVLRYKGKPVEMSTRSKDDVARLTLE
ncbi:helix-turn-helix domain-containing protein [Rhodocyclus tenuis]|uniref:Cytoskeleton protein RodZ n=1 Tax=Rhodocyclus tenuis TaxID=1066 RepID=A0A840GHI9_RHOTE|nr:helix-turn-helix domain-containing protein [Rhodocyclus tenuis]MBB4247649.1 cytoskeleton protein RodZ [Rhodocyclus tenuis]